LGEGNLHESKGICKERELVNGDSRTEKVGFLEALSKNRKGGGERRPRESASDTCNLRTKARESSYEKHRKE